jgi:hypothetical protein
MVSLLIYHEIAFITPNNQSRHTFPLAFLRADADDLCRVNEEKADFGVLKLDRNIFCL